MFNKADYLKSGVFDGNDYLVQPDGVKRCACCDELFYSVEFVNWPELVDGKMPVCIKCWRGKIVADKVERILSGVLETRICRKCGTEMSVALFPGYSKRSNTTGDKCPDCAPKMIPFWEKDSE